MRAAVGCHAEGTLPWPTNNTEQKPAPPCRPGPGERIEVYQHSDLLYWWVVWAYGFFCALLTWLRGTPVMLSARGHKPVLFYPGAWLGISFVMLVLFVLVFTNARARGVKSLVLFLVLAVVGLMVQMTVGLERDPAVSSPCCSCT